MDAGMKKWAFCIVVVSLFCFGISPEYRSNGISVFAGPAWAAESGGGEKVSKTGIPYVSDTPPAGEEELFKAIRARRGGELRPLDRMLLNSPEFARGWNTMFAAIRGKMEVSQKLRELAIVTIGAMNKADYEWQAHAPIYLSEGGTQAQLDAIKKGIPAAIKNKKLFNEAERATLALTYEMTKNVAVTKATMAKMRSILPTKQLVELIGTIAGYNMVSRFLIATGIEEEKSK